MAHASPHYPPAVMAGAVILPLLCVWGAWESYGAESAYQQQYRDPYLIAAQSTRFAPFVPSVPDNAELGYLTDLAPGVTDWAMFLGAQYALAPRLLERGVAHPWVLGNFTRPADFAAFGQAHGLKLQQDFGNGVVLFRKGDSGNGNSPTSHSPEAQ